MNKIRIKASFVSSNQSTLVFTNNNQLERSWRTSRAEACRGGSEEQEAHVCSTRLDYSPPDPVSIALSRPSSRRRHHHTTMTLSDNECHPSINSLYAPQGIERWTAIEVLIDQQLIDWSKQHTQYNYVWICSHPSPHTPVLRLYVRGLQGAPWHSTLSAKSVPIRRWVRYEFESKGSLRDPYFI